MALSIEQLTQEALALPIDARALFANQLAESLDPADNHHLQQLWADEASRRLNSVRSGHVRTIPGDEALQQVRRSLFL